MKKAIALACILIGDIQAHVIPDSLLDAIQKVETGGERDPANAVGDNGDSYGWLQIGDAVLADVNAIYPHATFTRKDTADLQRSRMIAVIYLMHYCTEERLGRTPTLEDAARIWNGGPNGWKKRSTRKYWAKVQKHL